MKNRDWSKILSTTSIGISAIAIIVSLITVSQAYQTIERLEGEITTSMRYWPTNDLPIDQAPIAKQARLRYEADSIQAYNEVEIMKATIKAVKRQQAIKDSMNLL